MKLTQWEWVIISQRMINESISEISYSQAEY